MLIITILVKGRRNSLIRRLRYDDMGFKSNSAAARDCWLQEDPPTLITAALPASTPARRDIFQSAVQTYSTSIAPAKASPAPASMSIEFYMKGKKTTMQQVEYVSAEQQYEYDVMIV